MPNAITLAQQFVPLLDETYQLASLTADLDGNADRAPRGPTAKALTPPMLPMRGRGDSPRNAGSVRGNGPLPNETVKCTFARARMSPGDPRDTLKTAGIAFGQLAGEFIRTKVAPEEDAFRFAQYAGKTGISKVAAGASLADGAAVIAALRAAITKMDEDEVPANERYLYITPLLLGYVQDMDTTKSREVMQNFAKVVKVPQSRFYTAIEQKSGKTGEEAGGYAKAEGGKDINFMILHKPALIQFSKHIAPKIIEPGANQDGDAYKFGYRQVAIADVYKNKVAGIYLHHKAT